MKLGNLTIFLYGSHCKLFSIVAAVSNKDIFQHFIGQTGNEVIIVSTERVMRAEITVVVRKMERGCVDFRAQRMLTHAVL